MNQATVSNLIKVKVPAEYEKQINDIVVALADCLTDDPLEKAQEVVEEFAPEAASSIVHSDDWREAETRFMQSLWYCAKVAVLVTALGNRINEVSDKPNDLATLLKGN